MKKLLVLLLVGLPSLANAQSACPVLAGKYSCPAITGQDLLKFSLEQVSDGPKTTYTFHYEGYDDDHTVASPSGELNAFTKPTYVFCVDQSLIYVKQQNDDGKLQQSFLSAAGEFTVNVNGKEVIRCPKAL